MLKNLGFGGTYRDINISISAMLENPLECRLEATELVFSIVLRTANGEASKLEDFTFYIMDEDCQLHNTRSILKPDTETAFEDGEPIRQPDGLIHTYLQHKFLFQDLRLAFCYRGAINIIELKH